MIDTILGTFSGKAYARDIDGNLYETALKPVLPIDAEFSQSPWLERKALTQACLHSNLFSWQRSAADGGNGHKFDCEVRQSTRQAFGW
jgi:hypothetical protein